MTRFLVLLTLFVFLFPFRVPAECVTFVSGTIINQTWTSDQSPYCVEDDINVAILTIQPGVEIAFQGNYQFDVAGKLTAVGAADNPIVFTVSETNADGWQGITFNNTQPGSQLIHCRVEKATNGGIHIIDSAPIIKNCIFSNNSINRNFGTFLGAGIHADVSNGLLVVENSEIKNNISSFFTSSTIGRSTSGGAGGLFLSGNVLLKNCLISENSTDVECQQGSGCLPGGGHVSSLGGGIYARDNITLENCIVRDNLAMVTGSAILTTMSSGGGGIYFNTGELTLRNSIFSNNSTTASCNCSGSSAISSGIHINSGIVNVENCSITKNTNEGLRVNGGTVEIVNSIVYFNQGSEIVGNPNVTYSDVQGGYGNPSDENIDFNPVFESDENLQIVLGSPCIDAGNPDLIYDDECFPPSLGNERNDIGAHGGPVACDWLTDVGIPGDLNGDGAVDEDDVALFAASFGSITGDPKYNPTADIDDDGDVDGMDLAEFSDLYALTITAMTSQTVSA
jgi:hypothetical protein